ncbi:conserved hypothetical protein [Candida dubliniensis CD36]|uniref:Uncharacterized protein n=1 Tax=Candida dubliniensis (strain CD36 / ATCC MYA-646 / CBS 7987 / NCPF 3949 / NRRL Y-17841) TaxID=573826 RepID=B9W8R6_CANDC|nr:conserved hypothetical protein [Candida dubliniensis CD36]CAX45139.1 conserved hypothetical protein [Candida dubliniensis CD36]
MTLNSTGDARKKFSPEDVHDGSSSVSTNVAELSNNNNENNEFEQLTPEQQRELEEELPAIEQELTDSEEEDEFIRRFGDIEFQYIKPPKQSVWFRRPHALNYFKDGVLYRTKGERTSSKTELFLDLLYVGIIANLAGEASEEASGKALLKYVLLFLPTWVVWADIKDFTNYYYNEDLSQKVYIFWILALLTLYINSHYALLNSEDGAALTIVPYILCRLSLAASYFTYSFFIPEHRAQSRLYSAMVLVTSLCWIAVIFVPTRVKIGLAFAFLFLEQVCFSIAYHPWTKKMMNLTTSTALNIEHEVERFSVFVTIAIGEFLYKVVAPGDLGIGFSAKFARGIFLLANAYILFWIYQYGSTSNKAIHPLRNSGWTAIMWIYSHVPLIAALVLAADAGGDLASLDNTSTAKHHLIPEHNKSVIFFGKEGVLSEVGGGGGGGEEEEKNMYALSFFYTGGISVSLVCMFILGLVEVSRDPPNLFILPKNLRIALRLPIAIIIVLLSLAELNTTLLMGLVTMLLGILLIYESVLGTPRSCLFDSTRPKNNTNTN